MHSQLNSRWDKKKLKKSFLILTIHIDLSIVSLITFKKNQRKPTTTSFPLSFFDVSKNVILVDYHTLQKMKNSVNFLWKGLIFSPIINMIFVLSRWLRQLNSFLDWIGEIPIHHVWFRKVFRNVFVKIHTIVRLRKRWN